MTSSPPSGSGDGGARLHRCIRDLAALNALPSMCIGRSPDGVLALILEALPTALSCDLVYLALPGAPTIERASIGGVALEGDRLRDVVASLARPVSEGAPFAIPDADPMWCLEAEVPIGAQRGLLVAGRRTMLDPDTDRVLVRSAANVVGATIENANLLDAARRKDDFLAMLGHELRGPLAPIMTAVELLARHPDAAREQAVIERNTRHLARLVDDLLDISRVTRGHVELRSERVPLATILARAGEIVAPLMMRHRHELTIAPSEGIMLQGDPVRLAQLFGNLLTNAAKFTPPHGSIDVTVERAGDRVRVAVRDNGRGIPREQLGRIFEPFVQVERERDALGGGLGLGLAIVHDLVARHGGAISAHSEGAGRGATFVVDLPVVAYVALAPTVRDVYAPTTRHHVRVLIVDDNVDLAELLSEALEHEGFQTAVAHDARAAIARWHTFAPHAAVLDVGMPEVDGYALARALRVEHGSGPTLIAATGYGQGSDRARATDAGFDLHFVKPVSVRDLVTVLDERIVGAAAGSARTG